MQEPFPYAQCQCVIGRLGLVMGAVVLETAYQDPRQEGEDSRREVEGPALGVQPELVQQHSLEPVLPDHPSNHHLVNRLGEHACKRSQFHTLGHGVAAPILGRRIGGVHEERGQHRYVLVL